MAEDTPVPKIPHWRILGLMLLGMALVGCAVYLSQRWNLAQKLSLDFRGTRAEGRAETSVDGTYQLRLVIGDRIMRRSYDEDFGFQRTGVDMFPVTLVYDPEQPNHFQPLGVSYRPGIMVGAVFALGMMSILYARRIVQQVQRAQRQQTKSKAKSRRS